MMIAIEAEVFLFHQASPSRDLSLEIHKVVAARNSKLAIHQ
jgi:hypothetical protein